MKKLLLIINPTSGKAAYRESLPGILYAFHQAGYRTTVAFTNRHGDATAIAETEGPAYGKVVCVGGDGTLGETVSGLMRLKNRPALGYIPLGTTNDCATTLSLSREPVRAARTAASGHPFPIDVGCFNGMNHFIYVAAFGAFTEVSYETPQAQKNTLGRMAYLLEGMRQLPKLTSRRVRMEYDGGVLEDDFIFGAVANGRSIAGILRLDEVGVSLNDGLFEIILIRTPESALQLGPVISNILTSNFSGEYITLLRTTRAKFTFAEPTAWTLDGEDGGVHTEVLCENIPHALKVMVDRDV